MWGAVCCGGLGWGTVSGPRSLWWRAICRSGCLWWRAIRGSGCLWWRAICGSGCLWWRAIAGPGSLGWRAVRWSRGLGLRWAVCRGGSLWRWAVSRFGCRCLRGRCVCRSLRSRRRCVDNVHWRRTVRLVNEHRKFVVGQRNVFHRMGLAAAAAFGVAAGLPRRKKNLMMRNCHMVVKVRSYFKITIYDSEEDNVCLP